MIIEVKKLEQDSVIPTKAHEEDAGFDLYCNESKTLFPLKQYVINTGIAFHIPNGWRGVVHGKSGLAAREGIDVLGGVIDSNYTGEVKVILVNNGVEDYTINKGDKVAQILFEENPSVLLKEVDKFLEMDNGLRGQAG